MLQPYPLILGLPSEKIDAKTQDIIQELRPAGFILFERNIQSTAQLQDLTAHLKDLSPLPNLLIAIDQEGGRIQRLRWRYPYTITAQDFGKLYDKDPAAAMYGVRLQAFLLASELSTFGISLNFAPVADIVFAETHKIIGNRAYHKNPNIVAVLCGAYIAGSLAGGCWPCIKHAPGHGRAVCDSHQELPTVVANIKDLQQDFEPFRQNNKTPFVMTAHIKYNALDKDFCATDSKKVIQTFLRDDLGMEGLIISDDLGMEALEGTLLDRGKRALKAGCDLLIVSISHMEKADGSIDKNIWSHIKTLLHLPKTTYEAVNKLENLPALKTPCCDVIKDAEEELTEILQMLA